MEFLEHLHKLGELLVQFTLFQALRVRDWDSRFSPVWSTLRLCFFFTQLFLMGLFLTTWSVWLGWITSSVFTSPITGGCLGTASSFQLLNVTAFTCSLPSYLGFTSELLGNAPHFLSVKRLAIWPICSSKFLRCAA